MYNVRHLIDGRELDSANGGKFSSINPATREVIAEVAFGESEDVDRAVRSAYRAVYEGPWGRMPASERAKILRKVADRILERVDALALLDTIDCGKPISDNLSGDIPAGAWLFEYYSGVARNIRATVLQGDPNYHHFTRREPYGVVGCIAPWNFPFAQACLKVAPALAAGNAVVVKMAEQTPLSTAELGKICLEAGIPAGVVNIVHGDGPTTGQAMVKHPLVGKISFTGSTSVGKEILRVAADQVKPVSLELGGKSPNLIFADADMDQALAGTLFTSFFNAGQICTTSSRLLLQEEIAGEVVERLVDRANRLKVGDPRNAETQLGPLVSEEQYQRVSEYIDTGLREGGELVCGGSSLKLEGHLQKGFFVRPTIFKNVHMGMRIAREEIFGPVLSVLSFKDESDAIRLANDVSYGLAAAIWTSDLRRTFRLADALDAGIVWVNTVHYSNLGLPYEGHKESGMGEDHGLEAIQTYTKLKTVYIHHGAERMKWAQ